jgi:hypothetical protein
MCRVETLRDNREQRVPRLVITAPSDTRAWAFRASVSRIKAAIEEMSDRVPDGAPWHIVAANVWDRRAGVCAALELHTYGGTDAECDLGVALLSRVADGVSAAQVAA